MISEEQRLRNMEFPRGPVDLVIDSDAYNEIDDQFAIAYAVNALEKSGFRLNMPRRSSMTVPLFVRGNENTIANNVISNSHAASIHVQGSRNILLNNTTDRDVILEGDGNVISGLVFTTPEARLVVRGENNRILGVPDDRVLYTAV